MRVPLSLVSQFVAPPAPYSASELPHGWDVDRLVDRLVMTGTEIEAVHAMGPESIDGFVVGRVLAVEPHPDADRLRVCRVDSGEDEPRTIVCGAPNVAAGQMVPVALPGAVMPGGMKIKKAKLRGVPSEGMICSEAELGISPESQGIMVLGELDRPPGQPLGEVISLIDTVLELEITPNRSDCFGIYGFAREVAAITAGELAAAPWLGEVEAAGAAPADALASVSVEAPGLCPRFTARVFDRVAVGPSPIWLKRALTALGQRPINNVVDITNYVMLITGQPLHAFDLDRVADGALTIRAARDGEKVVTLDGVERELDREMVVVCDAGGPAAIAGVMGGSTSEVDNATSRVLLEVANWDGPNILATSRRLALRSEASSRFERQLHPALCDRAQTLASRLLVELCAATMAPGMIDVAAAPPAERQIPFAFGDVGGLLGVEVPTGEAKRHLERLGFAVGGESGAEEPTAVVSVPVERHFDVTRPADLIEEIGRLHGYEKLPATIPSFGRPGALSRPQQIWRRVEDSLRHQGFDEIVGWSFTDPAEAGRLRMAVGDGETPRPSGGSGPAAIANPLSAEQSVMRTTLLGSLLDAAAYNLARSAERVALFESGRVYLPGRGTPAGDFGGGDLAGEFGGRTAPPVVEPHRIGALLVGPLHPPAWDGGPPSGGFFALKAVLEALAGDLGLVLNFEASADHPFLHPGRAAAVGLGGEPGRPTAPATSFASLQPIGWIGELHPGVATEWGLPEEGVIAFEVDLAPLVGAATAGEEIYADVISFPAVRQDLAIVVADEVAAGTVKRLVAEAGSPLLQSVEIFDLYRGKQLGPERKSLALRLEFQAADRTLTEAEVVAVREGIETAIESIGGSIRE